MSAGCWSQNDNTLGPQVLGCRGNFDFTIYFEEIVLIIAPTSLAILCLLLRFQQLRSQPVLAHAGSILAIKTVCYLPSILLSISVLLISSALGYVLAACKLLC
jgi:hypothetical protein